MENTDGKSPQKCEVAHKQEVTMTIIQEPAKGFQRRTCPVRFAESSKLLSDTSQNFHTTSKKVSLNHDDTLQFTKEELFWLRLPFDDERLRVYGHIYLDTAMKMLIMINT